MWMRNQSVYLDEEEKEEMATEALMHAEAAALRLTVQHSLPAVPSADLKNPMESGMRPM